MNSSTGTIDFKVGDETYQTWYNIVGDLKSGKRPLVTLHGGPGMSHIYMISHTEIYSLYGIPVIFYDQLGIGKSTHLRDKPAEFWTPELFMDQLDNLLVQLGIESDFDLLGHSWGGMLAADYVAQRQPPGLHRLVISSSPPSEQLWEESMLGYLEAFPAEFKEMVLKHEREGTVSSTEYQAAIQVFMNKHTCQTIPWPEELIAAFASVEEDPTVSNAMLGPAQFHATGSLTTWSVIDRIHRISCPTLVTNGPEEGAQDYVIAPFIEKIPKVKWVRFAKSHIAFFEDRDYYFKAIGDFLRVD
ncbi:proline-specific peptidase [Suillus subluteus]|nr:proline-specific peptidase [Suillus subluteus]